MAMLLKMLVVLEMLVVTMAMLLKMLVVLEMLVVTMAMLLKMLVVLLTDSNCCIAWIPFEFSFN
jgi:hypothetical protein